jgi:hypothetical protein
LLLSGIEVLELKQRGKNAIQLNIGKPLPPNRTLSRIQNRKLSLVTWGGLQVILVKF